MSFSVFESDIILCSAENILFFNYSTEDVSTVQLPKLILDKKQELHNNETEMCHGITSVTFSQDGQYVCICTNRKQLCLFNRKDRSLISNRTLIRAASRVRFTPNNDLVVADKSGDVYLYRSNAEDSTGSLILGHLSMLLDVMVSNDSKYIITADRDEKIRVSRFPDSYNIESYCLGHTNFVSSISLLSHDQSILVSGGGDGYFRLWDYKNGKELLTTSCNEKICSSDIEKLKASLKEFDLTEPVTVLPIKQLQSMQLNANTSILAVTLYGYQNILLYTVTGQISTEIKINFLQILPEDLEPLECLFKNQCLWVLHDFGVNVYKLQDNIFLKDEIMIGKLKNLSNSWQLLRSTVQQTYFYPILYKRKFDSVQDYQERKKSRLLNTVE